MTTNQTQVATRTPNAVVVLRNDLEKMAQQFRVVLPAQISPERFIRVVMTAVQNSPKLLKSDRASLFNSCMKCAQDGLLPDGREAALVPFADESSDLVQYLPMIAGIRKKVRNSGLLRDWNVQIVQQGDAFDYQLGDDPFIHHKPAPTGGRARPVLFAYSIATYPDGTKSREVMNADQLKDIQSKSKAKRGPWSDPIFYPEMCRKTVAKLHAKQLPMSSDLDAVLRRDDELYDLKGERAQRAAEVKPPPSVAAALDVFGAEPEQPAPMQDQELAAAPPADAAAPPPAEDPIAAARKAGYDAHGAGQARKAMPGELRAPERAKEAAAWVVGWDNSNNTRKSSEPGPGGTAALVILAAAAVLAMSYAPAFAACVTDYRSLPADHGWRHYRLVAGARCWYTGKQVAVANIPGKPTFSLRPPSPANQGLTNTVAIAVVTPIDDLRPPSPAELDVMPKEAVPGSPITNAVANRLVKPTMLLRPPSPASRRLMPKSSMPGSPIAFADRWQTDDAPETVPAVYRVALPSMQPASELQPLAVLVALVLAGLALTLPINRNQGRPV
jgi:recombination protein RecT